MAESLCIGDQVLLDSGNLATVTEIEDRRGRACAADPGRLRRRLQAWTSRPATAWSAAWTTERQG
ncbi:hypothetical protein QJS66_23570 (plasmid) [Kocuria rhizophila]|nr:hypothetical protein QJS66_23570 [Kocuria rhizophila]